MKSNKPEADTMLENDGNEDYDLMRDYANQLNGEIEEGEFRED
ncbi:hypothetical protein [Paenibacillus sp. yr247]|nr:hypothetical protein [Paenibacillus sp. yr247]